MSENGNQMHNHHKILKKMQRGMRKNLKKITIKYKTGRYNQFR